jgi:hypothetical protein
VGRCPYTGQMRNSCIPSSLPANFSIQPFRCRFQVSLFKPSLEAVTIRNLFHRCVLLPTRAQVDRYKIVLLKQRDIMIALTARLNERDEQLLALQEELQAYDSHQVRFCRDRFSPTGDFRIQADKGRGRVRIQVHCI